MQRQGDQMLGNSGLCSNDVPTDAIRVDNLVMKFTGNTEVVTAIDGLSFSVRNREFVSLVGPSGCGKSTCLGLIAGLRRPSYGEIRVCSNPVVGPIRNVGFMLQKDLLMPWRTVIGNVLFGLEIQGKGGREAREKAIHYLERFGLQDFADHRPRQLSGGMRQRVALIRTLLVDPDIILLDEPFAALDFQTRLLLENELWRILLEERKTVLLITHDIAEAISMSDRILVMSKRPGRVKTTIDVRLARASGSPLEARKHPEFNRIFEQVWEQLDVDVHL
jgi:NitT/TauT family transport system ATP-binding protein